MSRDDMDLLKALQRDMKPPFIGETQRKVDKLTSMQRAHWAWCDAVLAAQTDAGPPFLPPHLMLSKALAELMETIVKLNQQFAEDDPNRSR